MQVLNAFKSHLTGKVKTSSLNVYIVITTEGMTSQLKVPDVVFIKHPKIDYVAGTGNGSYLGTANNSFRKYKKTTLSSGLGRLK